MGDLSFWQIAEFLAAPFAASLILTGIHTYLGVHVVERGVIFVDLSLAQIAALGATIAMLMPFSGGDPHARSVYWVSLAFTFIGAAIFSLVRTKHARVPQEAIIGISYAVASAAAILAMSKSTSQAEHLKDMLVGNIIAVSWSDVLKTAGLYGAVGLFHFVFRKPFLAISMNHADAEATGLNVRLWDFLFYASFGFVVTSSVAIAGVLLVFCYLIVPSVAAMLYSEHIGRRLAIGWTMGTVVSALGVYLSLVLDLPTGATIVCTFGLVLILMAAVKPLIRSRAVAATSAFEFDSYFKLLTSNFHFRLPLQTSPFKPPTSDFKRQTSNFLLVELPMQCRQCGTEIAEKAIVCFRCGAGTSDPVRKAVPVKPRRSPVVSAGVLIALLLVALYLWQVARSAANPELPELAAGVALGAAAVVLLLAILRRR